MIGHTCAMTTNHADTTYVAVTDGIMSHEMYESAYKTIITIKRSTEQSTIIINVVLVPQNHFSLFLVLVLHFEIILVSISSSILSSQ